jgi:hypothetical protein
MRGLLSALWSFLQHPAVAVEDAVADAEHRLEEDFKRAIRGRLALVEARFETVKSRLVDRSRPGRRPRARTRCDRGLASLHWAGCRGSESAARGSACTPAAPRCDLRVLDGRASSPDTDAVARAAAKHREFRIPPQAAHWRPATARYAGSQAILS